MSAKVSSITVSVSGAPFNTRVKGIWVHARETWSTSHFEVLNCICHSSPYSVEGLGHLELLAVVTIVNGEIHDGIICEEPDL